MSASSVVAIAPNKELERVLIDLEKKDFDTANLSRKSKIEQNTPRYATILCNIKRYF